MARVELQPAYVLHRRAYRDSSMLVEAFSAEHGRVSLVARGGNRRARGGSMAALLQPFVPLLLSWSGRAELKTLGRAEIAGGQHRLAGTRLYSGLYLNELLMRLLHRHDPHPQLFATYSTALCALAGAAAVDTTLRRFELGLLDELGYRVELTADGRSGQAIAPGAWYRFDHDHGLVCVDDPVQYAGRSYRGTEVLSMAEGDFLGAARLPARALLREVLAVHLGEAPLRSRDLFGATGGRVGGEHAEPDPAPGDSRS